MTGAGEAARPISVKFPDADRPASLKRYLVLLVFQSITAISACKKFRLELEKTTNIQ
jgi:hypothetical protein